jgi:omega-amidase
LKVAAFQFGSSRSIVSNFEAIGRAVTLASESGVRLLVFHECAACGYPPVETPDIDGIDFEALDSHLNDIRRLAKTHNMYIALGTIRREGSRKYNSLLLIGPNGESLGHYDKRALWGWDLSNFARGQTLGVYEIDGIKIGFRICFEVRFPEYFRELFKSHVELCFVSFSDVSEQDSSERYDTIKAHLVTRAVENVMTVISVNSISKHQTAPTAVLNINGSVVEEAPKNKEYLLVYDYNTPETGYGAKGRIQYSTELLSKQSSDR